MARAGEAPPQASTGLRRRLVEDVRENALAIGIVTGACSALLLFVVAVLRPRVGESFGYFSRDATDVLGGPPYVGFLTPVGVLLLWTGASIALATAFVLARAGAGRPAAALAVGSVLTVVIALDDLFELHEQLRDAEVVFYAVYGLAVIAMLYRYRDVFAAHWPLFALALVCLAGSVAADSVVDLRSWAEDSLKLLGFAFWGVYFAQLSLALHGRTYGPGSVDDAA